MPGSRQVRRLIKRERDQLRKRLMLVEENSNVHIDEIRDHEEIEADQENLEVGQDNLELGEENLEVHENLDVDQENVLGGHLTLQRELPPQHLPSAGKPRNPYGSQTSSSQIHCWQQVANQTQTLGPLRIQTPHMHPLQFRLHSARSA